MTGLINPFLEEGKEGRTGMDLIDLQGASLLERYQSPFRDKELGLRVA